MLYMFIMRIHHAHGCNLGIHLRRLEPSARCWSRTCGLVRAPMWIVRGQALALAMALSIRTSAAHVEATPRNGAAVLKTIFRYKVKVRLGRYFSWNFYISSRQSDPFQHGCRCR